MALVVKNLTRRPLRTFFAVLGIAIGIAAVVGLISLARGFEKELDQMMKQLRGDVIIKQADVAIPDASRLDEELIDRVAEVPGVTGVSGYTFQMLIFGGIQVPVYGFLPGQPILSRLPVVEGRRIAENGLTEVMLGQEAALKLGVSAGDRLRIPPTDPDGREVDVVGIYATGSSYQDVGVVVHLRTAQLLMRIPRTVMMIGVFTADGDDAAVRDAIRERFGELDVQLAREFTSSLGNFQLLRKFVWAVSFIAAVVGAIGILNTMLMSVLERTREIGMLLALGWSRGMVLRMILAEGFVVSLVGGVIGIGIGLLLVELVASVIQELPIVGGHDAVLFGQAMALALVLGLFGSLLPAYKASRFSPVEALRYE